MTHKGKSSLAEVLINVASMLPWWVCIGLAGVSYLVLHAYAINPIGPITQGQVATSMVPAMLKGLASAGQYFMPILFGFAALLSFINRAKSESKLSMTATARQSKVGSTGTTPSCPLCSSPMVMRKAKKGLNAGNAFWGCSNFPQCKGTKTA